jgi:phosphonate transport system substrate-binding protein
LVALVVRLSLSPLCAEAAEKMRFAVGPFQPTPGDTKKAYEPFFKHLAHVRAEVSR